MYFSQRNQNKISELVHLYKKVKAIILYCEELDEDQYTNLQIPKELRDAFDHLMRAISEAESNVENADVNTIVWTLVIGLIITFVSFFLGRITSP